MTPAEVNPLANRTWGVYKGSGDQAWTPYQRAKGQKKKLLAKIALAPKAKWYGQWIPKNQITAKVRDHITNAQAGDPEALVQMTVFRLKPWEEEACRRLPTAKEQRDYKKWIDKFAAGIGVAHVALVLQPDGPFALCAPGWVTAPVPADRVRLARLQRAAQRQRLHRRRRVRLAAQRPCEGAQDPGSRRASTPRAASR